MRFLPVLLLLFIVLVHSGLPACSCTSVSVSVSVGSEASPAAVEESGETASAASPRQIRPRSRSRVIPGSSSSCLPRVSAGARTIATLGLTLPSPLFDAPIRHYGPDYAARKATVLSYICASVSAGQLSLAEAQTLFAIGMLETKFDPNEMDRTKDGTPSENYAIFNVNRDMISRAVPSFKNWSTIKSYTLTTQLAEVVPLMAKLMRFYGFIPFLNYMRGGYTGWKTGVAYGCEEYRQGIAELVNSFDFDPAIFSDDRRIDITIPHV